MILLGMALLALGLAVGLTTVWALGAAVTVVGAVAVVVLARQLRPLVRR